MESKMFSNSQGADEQLLLLDEGRDTGDIAFHFLAIDTNIIGDF